MPVNQSIYRWYAPVYDAIFGAVLQRARRRALALLDPQPGERLLIPGVGTGLDLPMLPAGVQVTAGDISPEMLRQAESKARACRATIELCRMDAQALDYPDGSFDAALLCLLASVAPDGRLVCREAWRVLRPGGRMLIFDKFLPEGSAPSPLRRAIGRVVSWLGTDPNRRLSELTADLPPEAVEVNEASLLGGQYRTVRLRKPG